MFDERRRDPRARSTGGVVHCESASGDRLASRWLDLGTGGLFVETNKPMRVGVRLSLEIEIPGEPATSPAVGRVTWIREAASADGKPPGMGVTFIDVDDAVLAAIGRLLAREQAAGSRVEPRKAAPSRERTVLGVGLSTQTPVAAAPIVAVAPSREKTVLGVAAAQAAPPPNPEVSADDLPAWPDEPPESAKVAAPAAEKSLPISLVVTKQPPEPEKVAAPAAEKSVPIDLVSSKAPAPSPAPEVAPEPSLSLPAGLPRRGRVGRFVFLLLPALAAGGGYAYRARLRPWIAPYIVRATTPMPIAAPIASSSASSPPAGPNAAPLAHEVESMPPPLTTATSAPLASTSAEVEAGARVPSTADAGVDARAHTHRPVTPAPRPRPVATAQSGDGTN